jgi:hypothetical protein
MTKATEKMLDQFMTDLAIMVEEKAFEKELKEYDEKPEKICYRLHFLLRSVTAYCSRLAINSLTEGDEKAAERLMAVNNMLFAQSPIELFEDTPKGTKQKVCFMSEEKNKENIAIVNEVTGELFTDSDCVPGDDEMPFDVVQALFGPLKKKEEEEKDDDGKKDEPAEEEPQNHLDEEVEELEKFLATLKEEDK